MTRFGFRGMLGGLLVPFIAVSVLAQGLVRDPAWE